MASGPNSLANIDIGQNIAHQGGLMPPPPVQAYNNEDIASKVSRMRKAYAAKGRVLEFLHAQIELEPFKSDPLTDDCWRRAITAAIEAVEKLK